MRGAQQLPRLPGRAETQGLRAGAASGGVGSGTFSVAERPVATIFRGFETDFMGVA